MKIFLTTIVSYILLSCSNLHEPSQPLDLAKRIFSKEGLPNIRKFCTGEYNGHPNGEDMGKEITMTFKILGQNGKTAVVNMTILDTTGNGLDTYLHFEKDTIWKMSAFRALAMTGFAEQLVQELEKMTPEQVENIIKESKGKKHPENAMFASLEEYEFELGNAKLTIALDDIIAKHFLTNQTEFERIKNIALKELETKKIDEECTVNLLGNQKSEYRKLFISSVSAGGYELGNGISFLIGGMVDNSVGYLFVKDKKDLPEMNSDNIIMIREIGNGWYIYKTT